MPEEREDLHTKSLAEEVWKCLGFPMPGKKQEVETKKSIEEWEELMVRLKARAFLDSLILIILRATVGRS